jgi:hypothetical protein
VSKSDARNKELFVSRKNWIKITHFSSSIRSEGKILVGNEWIYKANEERSIKNRNIMANDGDIYSNEKMLREDEEMKIMYGNKFLYMKIKGNENKLKFHSFLKYGLHNNSNRRMNLKWSKIKT